MKSKNKSIPFELFFILVFLHPGVCFGQIIPDHLSNEKVLKKRTTPCQITLRSLSDVSDYQLELNFLKPVLFVFFKADCPTCKKQISDLKCLSGQTEILLMGAFSSEEKLRREYRKTGTGYPAYYANNKVLSFFKITKQLTPQTLIMGHGRRTHLLGFQHCLKLKKSLSEIF